MSKINENTLCMCWFQLNYTHQNFAYIERQCNAYSMRYATVYQNAIHFFSSVLYSIPYCYSEIPCMEWKIFIRQVNIIQSIQQQTWLMIYTLTHIHMCNTHTNCSWHISTTYQPKRNNNSVWFGHFALFKTEVFLVSFPFLIRTE